MPDAIRDSGGLRPWSPLPWGLGHAGHGAANVDTARRKPQHNQAAAVSSPGPPTRFLLILA